MTVTITGEHVYLGVIGLLMVLQIFQWRAIGKLQKECSSLWEQIRVLVVNISNQITAIQKDLDSKENKK